MKKLFFIAFAIMFFSCSDDDGLENSNFVFSGSGENPYQVAIDFDSASKGHKLENLQVEDVIRFKYSISLKSGKEIPSGISFNFSPEAISQVEHQIINSDYELYDGDPKGGSLPINSISTDEIEGYFWIKILEPGNFKLNFKVSGNGVFVGEAKTGFNAVKIVAYRYHDITKEGSSGIIGIGSNASKRDFYHMIHIDNGTQQYDTYLNGLLFSVTSDIGSLDSIEFNPRTNHHFYDKQAGIEYKNLGKVKKATSISDITFTKEINTDDGIVISKISYKNIEVIDKGEHNDWNDKGDPELRYD